MKLQQRLSWDVLAGVLTWLLVFGLSLYLCWPDPALNARLPWAIPLFLLYGACFLLITRPGERLAADQGIGLVLYMLQLSSALALNWLLPLDYLAILSIIWVSLLPHLVRFSRALLIAVLVLALWFSVDAYLEQRSLLIPALLYGSFHLFALLMTKQARSEQQARQQLEQQHQQLVLAQQLLKASAQQQERSRIARDLHDVLGHHLTGLIIHLQVAEHQSNSESQPTLATCQQLARLLLADVREAVSELRQHRVLDLQQAVTELATALPRLQLHSDWQAELPLTSVQQAEQVLLIIQEALTNSLKHSGATQVQLLTRQEPQGVLLQISDNGQLHSDWVAGNGMLGMQERAALLGAELECKEAQGHMQLQLRLPLEAV
ncbi:sensor histidine kinase [Rheinheimera sp.]|uniref:sensor histidine kinase n=1 Tax=Rheinheimera sp. TaxID=1869214 RepID=UPI003AF543A4